MPLIKGVNPKVFRVSELERIKFEFEKFQKLNSKTLK